MKYHISLCVFVLVIAGCQPKVGREKTPISVPTIKLPEIAVMEVESENVRLSPNGEKIGQLLAGDTLQIIKRQGNWLFFQNDFFESAYIWAPSAGIEYINLYSPYSYYDTTAGQFYPLHYFRKIFGSPGVEKAMMLREYELFFGELGLGSHEDIVIEVVTEQIETTAHGVTVFIHQPENTIYKIKIDFFKPLNDIQNVIKQCDLGYLPPDIENGGHVIWNHGVLIPGLEIDLERQEWESEWFSAIWLKGKIENQRE